MVADALVKLLEGQWHTWYFFLVRTPDETFATILPPIHRSGTESVAGWRYAFDTFPLDLRTRIAALVCDGHRGLVYGALRRGWVLQRCHFHLIAAIQGRRSRWASGRHRDEGREIHALVRTALTTPDDDALRGALSRIEALGWDTSSPGLKAILSGFVNHCHEYRSYIVHPELHLPTTNNTAEALIGLVEELGRRARGFRTVATLHEWIMALVKVRQKIRCAPAEEKNQQN